MSLSLMSHVEFKKCLCHSVDFRGQGPSLSQPAPDGDDILIGVSGEECAHPDLLVMHLALRFLCDVS